MKRFIAAAAALLLLTGCGSSDSSSRSETSAAEDVSSAVSAGTADEVEKQHGNYEVYPTGYYRVLKDTTLYDKADNATQNDAERLCIGSQSGDGLKIALPVPNGQNELGEVQYKYENYIIKDKDKIIKSSVEEARDTVVNYAVAMSNKQTEVYTLSGELVTENETRSDCSGLTELAYLQIGLYMEHYAEAQANNYGNAVFDNLVAVGTDQGNTIYNEKDPNAKLDYSVLEKGDLLFFLCPTNSAGNNDLYTQSGIGHVAMYIGDGKMVHFTADYGETNDPCRIEDLASYETRLKVEKAVRYIF